MTKILNIKGVWMVCLMLLSILMAEASNTSFLIDVSGSMNGLSKVRTVKSLDKVKNEIKNYIEGHDNDSIQIVTFTDRIIDCYWVTPSSTDIESKVDKISFPRRGNTNLKIALESINSKNFKQIVIISDGRHNIGNTSDVISELKSNKTDNGAIQYYFLLDESDSTTPLIKEISDSDYIIIINSLTEIQDIHNGTHVTAENNKNVIAAHNNTDSQSMNSENTSDQWSDIDLFKIVLWLIIFLFIFGCIFIFVKISIAILPLFKMVSAGAIQKAIAFLYNLPKPLFIFIFKVLPSKMKSFLKEYMPSYEDYSRGNVIPKNDTQKQTLDEWEKQTGKRAKYKNGEIDFSDVAEHKEKLNGSLDDNIPNGTDPRKKVSFAQDRAANQMLNSKTGRVKIANYVGKNPNDIKYEDYTSWKDDSLNQGKPNHNPKTPHESIDGREIMWVPKRFHDVAWGGISHTGGVSMLKSIRNYFGLNI